MQNITHKCPIMSFIQLKYTEQTHDMSDIIRLFKSEDIYDEPRILFYVFK